VLLHLTAPAFIIPQLLNLCGSILFAISLGPNDLSIAVPLANGTSLFANAIVDHFLGNGAPIWPGLPGILLIITGVTLCSGS
jgi:Putative transmembrane family 234